MHRRVQASPTRSLEFQRGVLNAALCGLDGRVESNKAKELRNDPVFVFRRKGVLPCGERTVVLLNKKQKLEATLALLGAVAGESDLGFLLGWG